MAGHSRPKDGVASARLCPGHDEYELAEGCGDGLISPAFSPVRSVAIVTDRKEEN